MIRKVSESDIGLMYRLRDEGLSYSAIARRFDVHYMTAYFYIRAKELGFASRVEYIDHLARKKGFRNNNEYKKYRYKLLTRKNGFKNYQEYKLDLLKKKGFSSVKKYRANIARRNGFSSYGEYKKHLIRKSGFSTVREYYESNAKKKGFSSFKEHQDYLARKNGFRNNSDRVKRNQELLAKRKGFRSYYEYEKYLVRKRGFPSILALREYWAKRRGFSSAHKLFKYLAKKRKKKAINRELSLLIQYSLGELDKNQLWLSERLGISESAVSRYTSGETTPRASLQKKLFRVLNLPYKTLDDILKN